MQAAHELSINVGDLNLTLTQSQFHTVLTQVEFFSTYARFATYSQQNRPRVPIGKATAGEWWRYAGRCAAQLNGRTVWLHWERIRARREVRIEYITLYRKTKKLKWIKKEERKITAEETTRMEATKRSTHSHTHTLTHRMRITTRDPIRPPNRL